MRRTDVGPHLNQRAKLAARVMARRLTRGPATGDVVDRFHELYYDAEVFGGTWAQTAWLGVPVWKCPFDLWVYQELFHRLKPELVIETGTAWGGSALFMASLFDLIGHGSVLSIDVRPRDPRPEHARIRYLTGSSTDPAIFAQVCRAAGDRQPVVVVLDSDHRRDHVLAELRLYSRLVPVDSYLVVEDTNVNGHPVRPDFGPGPMEAVARFVAETEDFVVDRGQEKFHMTMNPGGFLRRVG